MFNGIETLVSSVLHLRRPRGETVGAVREQTNRQGTSLRFVCARFDFLSPRLAAFECPRMTIVYSSKDFAHVTGEKKQKPTLGNPAPCEGKQKSR